MRLDLLVNDFTYRAVNDRFIVLFEPHFKRNYLHVRDAAHAFLHTIKNYQSMKGRPFNVGLSDANLSKMELCQAIKNQVPELQLFVSQVGEDPDKRNYVISNRRMEETGYRPRHSLAAGIHELVNAFRILKRTDHSNV